MTLRAGLPSAAGERLRASVEQEVYVRDRTPAVRFAGRAYVLPKSAEASVPIVSVNAAEAALRLYRVGTRNVATVIGNGDFGSPLTGGEETRVRDTLGEPVWEGTGELAQELNRDVTTTLPMGDVVAGLEPGLYALTARVADAPSRRGLGGLGDAVVRGDRSRAGGADRRGRAACLPPRPVGCRRARGRRGDAARAQQRRAWPGGDRRARARRASIRACCAAAAEPRRRW